MVNIGGNPATNKASYYNGNVRPPFDSFYTLLIVY